MRILIKNIEQLVQVETGQGKSFVSGTAMSTLPIIENAFLLINDRLIEDFGPMSEAPQTADRVISAKDKFVLPAWCDSHTHLVYAGSRESEFVDRINGLSYEEIGKKGGGILNSAKKLQETPAEELLEQAYLRLGEIKDFGTGAVEIKSGYGLSVEAELKMLAVIKQLKSISEVSIKATFLGAHAFPAEYKENKQGYIDLIIKEMLPKIADQGLADYVDVFCERGYFSVDQTSEILEAAAKYGLKPKIHANQLAISGGVQVGVKHNAISVDHLENIGEEEIACLKDSNTIATLLPSCSFFINLPYAPARKLMDADIPVAIASDYNPGSTPGGKMSFLLSLACIKMKMTPEEAINAITLNGAAAMELSDKVGSIKKGKLANLIITKKIPSLAYIPYSFSGDIIESVFIQGKLV